MGQASNCLFSPGNAADTSKTPLGVAQKDEPDRLLHGRLPARRPNRRINGPADPAARLSTRLGEKLLPGCWRWYNREANRGGYVSRCQSWFSERTDLDLRLRLETMALNPTPANPLRRDLPDATTPEPCCVALFGATGDLTQRKLIPALYNLAREGFLPAGFTVIGVSRRDWTDDQFREATLAAVGEHSRHKPVLPEVWRGFAQNLFYQKLSFDHPADYVALGRRLKTLAAERRIPANCLFYLATAPEYFATAAEQLHAAGLVAAPHDKAWTRLVVEKPFGRDLASAADLNCRLQAAFDESQIFRIDHYLGKETVQNILVMRFANAIFEPIWNRRYVDHVQITVAERVGMEGRRGQYYDTAGATRDMVQNHMMQLLSLVAMEPPVGMDARAIRDEKVKVLRALQPLVGPGSTGASVRGQYGPGSFAGNPLKGYCQEEAVEPASSTETFVALRLHIDTWRWSGVPFYLRTGKRLPKRLTEVAIQFRSPPMAMFAEAEQLPQAPNQLVLRVQPDEGISLSFEAKVPGMRMRIQPVKMDFRYGTSFGGDSPEAYERLLLDAMLGDATLFISADEVDYSWRLISPVLESWTASPTPKFPNYEAGTWGPAEADTLFGDSGHHWRRL